MIISNDEYSITNKNMQQLKVGRKCMEGDRHDILTQQARELQWNH